MTSRGVHMTVACCAPLALLAATADASAQVIQGHVIESTTRAPLPGTTIIILDTNDVERIRVAADSAGAFAVPLAAGVYRLRAELDGYAAVRSGDVRLVRAERLSVEVRLDPNVIAIEPLIVTGRSAYRSQPLDDYYRRLADRRRSGRGRFVTREEIAGSAAVDINSLLRREALISTSHVRGHEVLRVHYAGQACIPQLYLDGMRVGSAAQTDLRMVIPPEQIEGIEIYRNSLEAPIEFGGCAVAVWSRRDSNTPLTWRRVAIGAAIGAAILFLF